MKGCRKNNGGDPLKVLGRSKGYSKKDLIANLPRHAEFRPSHLKYVKRIPDAVLRNLGTPQAKKLIKMMRDVFKEAYRAKQFTRTEINDRGVLYGIVSLKHKTIDLVLKYFHERWPQCIICLYNEHTQKTGIINERGNVSEVKKPIDQVVKKISEKRPKVPYFEDIQFSGRKIFETLYKSQNIKERENPRYFKSMIPKKCFDLPGLRESVEKDFISTDKRLDEFL